MQLISKFNKRIHFSLCVIDIFGKYSRVVHLKEKKGITIFNAFQVILDESNHKTNKIWVDKWSEFYNRSMKSWLQENDIKMYSTYNQEKSVVVERFIRTLKDKIYKCIYENVYINNLGDIVNKYNNTCHSTIKLKPVDVK